MNINLTVKEIQEVLMKNYCKDCQMECNPQSPACLRETLLMAKAIKRKEKYKLNKYWRGAMIKIARKKEKR